MRWFRIHRNLKYLIAVLILCILPYLLVIRYLHVHDFYARQDRNDKVNAKELFSLNVKHLVTNEEFEFTVEYKEVSLVVCVLSKADHFEQRTAIRQTWALSAAPDTLVVFVIGMKTLTYGVRTDILKESVEHKDLLLLRTHKESYAQLTQKVVQSFKCISERVKFDYLLKVDDDTFVRLDEFKKKLKSQPADLLYWGYFNSKSGIVKEGKWEEKKSYDHICETYVTYALGGGYVLSRDLVLYITHNSDKLIYFTNEDVAVGTWLAPLEINRVHDDVFRMAGDCDEKHIILHYASKENMKEFSNNLLVGGTLCGNTSVVSKSDTAQKTLKQQVQDSKTKHNEQANNKSIDLTTVHSTHV